VSNVMPESDEMSPLEDAVRRAQDLFDALPLAVAISSSLSQFPEVWIPSHKRNLKPKDVFAGIERCYQCWEQHLERPHAAPGESFEVSLRYLLSTATACGWFNEQQYERLESWLEDVVGLTEERRMRHKAERDSAVKLEGEHDLRGKLDAAMERAVNDAIGVLRHRMDEQLDVMGIERGVQRPTLADQLLAGEQMRHRFRGPVPVALAGVDMTGNGQPDLFVRGVDRNLDGIPDVLQGGRP